VGSCIWEILVKFEVAMASEIHNKCEQCGRIGNTLNQYKFYYGCVTSSPTSRQLWFDPSPGMTVPAYAHQRIHESKEVWICDGGILRKRISYLWGAIVLAAINFVIGAVLYCYWTPIVSAIYALDRLTSKSCCFAILALFVVLLVALILLSFPIGLLAFLATTIFEKKEKIGDSIAIEIHKKAIEESVNWINPDPVLINGFCMEPRRVMGFWTRKQRETEKFP